jgi:3-dehydroquinate dehydratase-1
MVANKLLDINGLTVGSGAPRVVGTVSSKSGLLSFPGNCEDLCDIAEVRLDEIGIFDGWVDACKAIEASGIPVMVTLRNKSEGGKCDLSKTERLSILKEALDCCSIVDVEFSSNLAKEIKPFVESAGKILLVSFHDFKGTPDIQNIRSVIDKAAECGSIVKIATMVNSDKDLQVLHQVLNESNQVNLCLIGMGAIGTKTRTSFPCLGSCLTYGYLDYVSAPGQLTSRRLVEHLRLVDPKYNEEFIIRHEILECV